MQLFSDLQRIYAVSWVQQLTAGQKQLGVADICLIDQIQHSLAKHACTVDCNSVVAESLVMCEVYIACNTVK